MGVPNDGTVKCMKTKCVQVPDDKGQRVPELLTDIMNLEALLADDDIPQEGAGGDPCDEQVFYNYLMQLTELRLYKLVRWARNLPQFGAISVSLLDRFLVCTRET